MKSRIVDLKKISDCVYQYTGEIFIFDKNIRNLLIETANKSIKKRSRICLHKNTDSNTQNMIICLLKNQKFTKHKHPENKSESYTVILGELYVDIYEKHDKLSHTLTLNNLNTPYMHSGGCIHQPFTKDNIVIYHEIYHGKFNRKIDMIEYF